MSKKILIISGSPKKDGNTSFLIKRFLETLPGDNIETETVSISGLDIKVPGCMSCRTCQDNPGYGCVIKDGLSPVLIKMLEADIIVIATPLYFFSASAQTKTLFDRMFSLYKWDNENGTMETPLKGKTFAVMASAFEDTGLGCLERPFRLTADYTGMHFASLLVPYAGISGDLGKKNDITEKMAEFVSRLLD